MYAKSAVVIDDSGSVLFQKEPHSRLSPGSMTKLLSLLLVFESIRDNTLTLDERVSISQNAANTNASKAGLILGEYMTVHDLILCVLLPSGSDAVIALAERISGSQEAFVERMNERVKELDLNDTHYSNCVGVEDENLFSSAYDMSIIALELVSQFPEVLTFSQHKSAIVYHEDGTPLILENTNDMLGIHGVNGLKTGSTPQSGYSLTMTYPKNGKIRICVIMNSPTLYCRRQDCMSLLELD